MPDPSPPDSAGEMDFEFHFQDGFTGQNIRVLSGGQELAQFTAKTRMQIGAAEVLHLSLSNQEEVTIIETGAGAPVVFNVSVDRPNVLINRDQGILHVTQTAELQRYI